MGQKTFDMLLHLVGKGFTVSFSKAESFRPATVLRLELCKDDKHRVELIDISISRLPNGITTDDIITRYLQRGEWIFENEFEREANV